MHGGGAAQPVLAGAGQGFSLGKRIRSARGRQCLRRGQPAQSAVCMQGFSAGQQALGLARGGCRLHGVRAQVRQVQPGAQLGAVQKARAGLLRQRQQRGSALLRVQRQGLFGAHDQVEFGPAVDGCGGGGLGQQRGNFIRVGLLATGSCALDAALHTRQQHQPAHGVTRLQRARRGQCRAAQLLQRAGVLRQVQPDVCAVHLRHRHARGVAFGQDVFSAVTPLQRGLVVAQGAFGLRQQHGDVAGAAPGQLIVLHDALRLRGLVQRALGVARVQAAERVVAQVGGALGVFTQRRRFRNGAQVVLLRLRGLAQVVQHHGQVALELDPVVGRGVGFDPGFGGAHVDEGGVEVAGHAHRRAQALAHRRQQRLVSQRASQRFDQRQGFFTQPQCVAPVAQHGGVPGAVGRHARLLPGRARQALLAFQQWQAVSLADGVHVAVDGVVDELEGFVGPGLGFGDVGGVQQERDAFVFAQCAARLLGRCAQRRQRAHALARRLPVRGHSRRFTR